MIGHSQEYMDYQNSAEESFADNVIGQKFPGTFNLEYCEEHDRHYKKVCSECWPTEPETDEDLMDDDSGREFDIINQMRKSIR